MSRIARIVIEGVPYHITQRGNGRQQVFFEDRDYQLYRDLLRRSCEAARLRIWAYCLMPNHVHLIGVPECTTSMAQAVGRANADYARHYNLQQRTCGHVWQARYFSTPLDNTHLWQAMAYVERNPVRARIVAHADDFRWSSTRARRAGGDESGFLAMRAWRAVYDWPRWREALETSVDEEAFGQRLQEASRRGRPLGSEEFTERLERRCGRRLRPLPVGRPPKPGGVESGQIRLGFGA